MIVRLMFVYCRKIKYFTRKYMRLGDSHTENEVPSGCAYIWKLNLFWGGVYVVKREAYM